MKPKDVARRAWSLNTRLALGLSLVLGLGACAQMVVPTPQQQSNNAIAVQAGRLHILSLSPQVNAHSLVPAQRALSLAQAAQNRGDYLLADRETRLAEMLLNNVQTHLNSSPEQDQDQQIQRQIRDSQAQIAQLQQKIAATRQQLGASQ